MAGLTRERRLAAYLSQSVRKPFAWGSHDCCLFVAGWIEAERGVDTAGGFRSRYRTELGAARLIRRAGGFLPFLGRLAATAGLSRVDDPRPGDVGVVQADDLQVAAIRTRIGWAALKVGGMAVRPWPALVSWRV